MSSSPVDTLQRFSLFTLWLGVAMSFASLTSEAFAATGNRPSEAIAGILFAVTTVTALGMAGAIGYQIPGGRKPVFWAWLSTVALCAIAASGLIHAGATPVYISGTLIVLSLGVLSLSRQPNP